MGPSVSLWIGGIGSIGEDMTSYEKARVPLILAVLVIVAGVSFLLSESEGTGEDLTGYGTVEEISISPGYQWTYTAEFNEAFGNDIALSFEKNELGSIATLSGMTLNVSKIPASMAGNKYNVVLKAYHAKSDQTEYQWIRFTVAQAMDITQSGLKEQIVKGDAQNITLSTTGGIGNITWSKVSGTNDLSVNSSTGKITGNPTTAGLNKITVKATSDKGESKTKEFQFTVFNKIVGGSDETLKTYKGKNVSSTAITQTGTDLGVTWRLTSGTMPAGMSLNASTGVVSGTYTGSASSSVVLTLTGTAANGPTQTATKKITVSTENTLTISGANDTVYFYNTNKTVTLSSNITGTTWAISPSKTGVSVSNTGVVTFTAASLATGSGTVTVKATSPNQQEATKTIQYEKETELKVTAPSELGAKQGRPTSVDITITGGAGNTVTIGTNAYGNALTFNASTGKLSISYPTAHAKETVTLTVTSKAGQTATATIDVTVYPVLGFDSKPSFDGAFFYLED